jgi:hypothetical protein
MLNINIEWVRKEVEEELQKALDNKDISEINKWMEQIYPDYMSEYGRTMQAYNEDCDIHAVDLINFRLLHPNARFILLVCLDEKDIKKYCEYPKVIKELVKM